MKSDNWKKTYIDIGEIKPKTKALIDFKGKEGMKQVMFIQTSCHCTQASFIPESKILNVVYSAGSIPVHLRSVGEYSVRKSIRVTYIDNSGETLIFSAKIKQ